MTPIEWLVLWEHFYICSLIGVSAQPCEGSGHVPWPHVSEEMKSRGIRRFSQVVQLVTELIKDPQLPASLLVLWANESTAVSVRVELNSDAECLHPNSWNPCLLPYLPKDVIKDLERRSLFWITWVDPKRDYKKETDRDQVDTWERRWRYNYERLRSSGCKARNTCSQQNLEEAKSRFFPAPYPLEGVRPGWHLHFWPLASRIVKNKFPLVLSNQFVVICYSSHRKLVCCCKNSLKEQCHCWLWNQIKVTKAHGEAW